MNSSTDGPDSLLPEYSALQHERAPRPLPLFLELVRHAAERDPELGRNALAGLSLYERAERVQIVPHRPTLRQAGGAKLLDYGGSGPPAVLIPSLINPPYILDLDPDVSFATAIVGMQRRVLLLDWGAARERAAFSVADHVTNLLVPLLQSLEEPAAVIGYCLGGTMALAAANLIEAERIVTLATPWNFSEYPDRSRAALADLWQRARPSAEALQAMPMEVLQSAFWSLDPERTVVKFAKFAALPPGSADARRFVALEDWANEGEPLPVSAARELIEDFFAADLPGTGRWIIDGQVMSDGLSVPMLHCTASGDRIAPASTAPSAAGEVIQVTSGHVGMIVGSARHDLHATLSGFLKPACR